MKSASCWKSRALVPSVATGVLRLRASQGIAGVGGVNFSHPGELGEGLRRNVEECLSDSSLKVVSGNRGDWRVGVDEIGTGRVFNPIRSEISGDWVSGALTAIGVP